MDYENKCSKYTRKVHNNIINKLINNITIDENDINEINTILQNTILENYNFQYDNPIHRGILMTVISNNTNIECNLYTILEKTKIYIHNFYNK
jgi:galactokinase/mevalonate kinase-like predicted kinase